jgi:hypothetical protein
VKNLAKPNLNTFYEIAEGQQGLFTPGKPPNLALNWAAFGILTLYF